MQEFRHKMRLAIFYGKDKQQLMSNYSVDMSSGGMFIETLNPLPANTPLVVEFMLPIKSKFIVSKARVAWVNSPGALAKPSLPPGMGIELIGLSPEDAQFVRKYLNEYELKPIW